MKNLDYALRVLAQVRTQVRFSIYGPIEVVTYWEECQKLMAELPANVEVNYCGSIEHDNVVATISELDLFFLPSRGENFGHVIHEALRAGLPLLISDRTPWKDLAELGVGWDLALGDMSAFVRRIEEVADWSDTEHQQRAARARALAHRGAHAIHGRITTTQYDNVFTLH